MHRHSPNQPGKFKQISARNLMAAVFWDRKGVLMVEFMQHGATVISQVYCKTLKELLRAIQYKMCGMLTCDVLLSMTMHVCIQLLPFKHCWSISAGSCLTTLLTALFSLRATTTCLPT
jgi:hypothetical protein